MSLVGETNRLRHIGSELAVAVLAAGRRTRVLRTAWRIKDAQTPPGLDENKRPDFQELLVGVRLGVFVRPGAGEAVPTLAERVAAALANPTSVSRFGGLALGESTHLVDEVRPLRAEDRRPGDEAVWLVRSATGALALPIWPDHVGSAGTAYGQFETEPVADLFTPPDAAWVRIAPRDG